MAQLNLSRIGMGVYLKTRPVGQHDFLADVVRRILEQSCSTEKGERKTRLEIIIERMIETASNPEDPKQVAAAKWLAEQAYGLAPRELSESEKQLAVLRMLLNSDSILSREDRESILGSIAVNTLGDPSRSGMEDGAIAPEDEEQIS